MRTTVDLPDCFSAGMLHAVELIAIQARLTGSMECLLAWSPRVCPDIARLVSVYSPSAIRTPCSSLIFIIYGNRFLILDTVLI